MLHECIYRICPYMSYSELQNSWFIRELCWCHSLKILEISAQKMVSSPPAPHLWLQTTRLKLRPQILLFFFRDSCFRCVWSHAGGAPVPGCASGRRFSRAVLKQTVCTVSEETFSTSVSKTFFWTCTLLSFSASIECQRIKLQPHCLKKIKIKKEGRNHRDKSCFNSLCKRNTNVYGA